MPELKAKVTLKQKGEEFYIAVKQVMVTLKWTASVDLDLMAFYKTKDGRVGGIYSDNYAGGSLGNLNAFPFIQLSGDAGVGAKGGVNEEVLRIAKMDDMAEVYICTLNYTDASAQRSVSFAQYDAGVVVVNDSNESIGVMLDSNQTGTVAIIAKIDNTNMMGAKLINENRVLDLNTFKSSIPGANNLEIASKISLKTKGQSIELKKKGGALTGDLSVNLNWNQGNKPSSGGGGFFGRMLGGGGGGGGVDLDLGCLFELKSGQKGSIQALGNAFGSYNSAPYIQLSGDDRTGSNTDGETLRINANHVNDINRILVYTYIYEGVRNWSQTDAVITIRYPGGADIEIRVNEHQDGQVMCALALFTNVGGTFKVERSVTYYDGHQPMDRAFSWGLNWVRGSKD